MPWAGSMAESALQLHEKPQKEPQPRRGSAAQPKGKSSASSSPASAAHSVLQQLGLWV